MKMLNRTERKKERTRQAFLDVALQLFAEKGIYWTKIEDLTEKADVAKGTFYQYFETKEHLLEDVLNKGLNLLQNRIEEKIKDGSSMRDVLLKIIDVHYDFLLDHTDYLLIFHQVRGLLLLTGEGTDGLRKSYLRFFREIGRRIQHYLKLSAKQKNKMNEIILNLSAFALGLFTHLYLFDQKEMSDSKRALFRNRVMNGLEDYL